MAFGAFAGQNDTKKVANLPEKEIRDLSYAIKAADTYRADKNREIKTLVDSLAYVVDEGRRWNITLNLARIFRPVNTDSSLYYAQKAKALAQQLDLDKRQESEIAVINALSTAGLFTDANEKLRALQETEMSDDIKIKLWVCARRLYGYMRSYAQGNLECYLKYNGLYQQYDDSLLSHLPVDSKFLQFIQCERLVTDRQYNQARKQLLHLLESVPQEDNIYGMAAFQLAEVWKNLGDDEQYAAMLAVSALSDVKCCVSEGLALPTLAYWLYEKGEFSEAFNFINFALEEATAGSARMRAVTIAQLVPLIDDAYKEKINSSRDELMVYFILVTVFLVLTIILAVFLNKEKSRSRKDAERLAETSKLQESYIGNFLGLYSSYADKLNRFVKLVSAKLAAGQGAELKKLVDSGKYADQDNDDIHKIFDAAFLDIYPTFVDEINALLREEDKIVLKTPGTLTPELRIYAFVRLGIDESTRIANILHYSTNTVYAYRNKMRNKAIIRDTFDRDVASIRGGEGK